MTCGTKHTKQKKADLVDVLLVRAVLGVYVHEVNRRVLAERDYLLRDAHLQIDKSNTRQQDV